MMRVYSIKKKLVTVLVILLVSGIVLQFFRPALDNPPVTAEWSAPPEVKTIFRRACYDCHSNQTRLAWFDQPVPAYWLVDLKAGVRWDKYDVSVFVRNVGNTFAWAGANPNDGGLFVYSAPPRTVGVKVAAKF